MKKRNAKINTCYSCKKPYFFPKTITIDSLQSWEFAEGDPRQWADHMYCGRCIQQHHNYQAALEESWQQARAEEQARRKAEYDEWRGEQYAKRVEEKRRQDELAYEYRIEHRRPDPEWESWKETLRYLAQVGGAR